MEKYCYIVVVTYNPGKWIDDCFSSLRNSIIPLKTIVIDNGSTDGSQEIIKRDFPEVKLIQSNENLGFGKANNIGIKMAYEEGAEYVFLLNQDAWIEADTIKKLVESSSVNPDFGVISPIHLNGKGSDLDFNFSKYLSPNECPSFISDLVLDKVSKTLYKIKFVNAAAWLLTRKCIETVGGFNPLFNMYGEDDNYLQRVFYHGLHIGILPGSIIYHDREVREKSAHQTDEKKIFIRNLLTRYCNPNNPKSIESELHWRKRVMMRDLIKLNIVNYRKLKAESSVINDMSLNVETTKKISQIKGLSFL